jgi:tetratricopeptide (TPR) repeat protein
MASSSRMTPTRHLSRSKENSPRRHKGHEDGSNVPFLFLGDGMRVFLYSHEAYQYTAWSIQADLAAKGHELFVFIDKYLKQNPAEEIYAANYLVMIAPPAAFAQSYAPGNGTKRLIMSALAENLPIIPLTFVDESLNHPHYQRFIHESIAGIREFDAFRLDFADWEATIEALNQRLIQTNPKRNGDFKASELSSYDNEVLVTGRKAEEIYEQGNRYYLDKAYQQAKDFFDEALALRPEWYSAYNNRALAYYQLDKNEEALDDINEAIRLSPDRDAVWSNRALIYHELKRYSEAIDDASKALELNPELSYAYSNRANAYSKLDSCENALKDLNEAIKLDNKVALLYGNRAKLFKDMENFDEALEDFNRAIELDAEDAGLYKARASVYVEQNKLEAALADYEKGIALNPPVKTLAGLYNERGVLYHSIHQYEAAICDFNKAIELSPKDAVLYANRSNSYRGIEQYEKAMEDCNQALAINPNTAHAYYARAALYKVYVLPEKAIAELKHAIELDDKNSSYYHLRGFLYFQKRLYNPAIADLTKAIELKPKSMSYYMRGYCYSLQGRLELAKADFEDALELEPTQKEAQKALEDVEHMLDSPGCWGLLAGEKRKRKNS